MRRSVLGLLAAMLVLLGAAPASAQLPVGGCGDGSGVGGASSDHFDAFGGTAAQQAAALAALEAAYARVVTEFGWWAPRLPALAQRYAVVLDDNPSPAAGGEAVPTGSGGDNPGSPWADGDGQASCLHLQTGYADDATLRAVAVREVGRMVLIGIGAHQPASDPTLTESSLALLEQLALPGNPVAHGDLWPDFADSLGAYDAPNKRSQWLALRGMTERVSAGTTVMQSTWRAISEGSAAGLDALDDALGAAGVPLGEAFHDYAVAARAMRPCTEDQLPFCFADAAAYVARAGARPDHKVIAAVGDAAAGAVEDGYAVQWVKLPPAMMNVTVRNTDGGGTMRATAVCLAGAQSVRQPLGELGPGASATLQAFPPTGCRDPAVVLTSSSRTAADPQQSTPRAYAVETAPPTIPLTVRLAGTGSGVVTSTPGGIACGTQCSQSFGPGTTVTLAAAPAKGSTFGGWSGACSGSATTCTLTLGDTSVATATFTATGIVGPPASETSTLDPALVDDRRAPRLGFGKPRLGRRTLDLPVRCPATEPNRCSGYVALVARAGGKRVDIGQQAFVRLRGGRRKILRFPLSSRARRTLRRAARPRVAVTSRTRDDAFNYVTQRRTLALG